MKHLLAFGCLLAALLIGVPARAQDHSTQPELAAPETGELPESAARNAEIDPATVPLGFSTHPEAEAHYRKALGLVDDYRGLTVAGVKEARAEFRKGLAMEPDNQLARLMWARVMLRLTNYEVSVEEVGKIEQRARDILAGLDLSGEDGLQIRKERARVYLYELQELDKGEADLVYLVEHGEPDVEVLLALGQTRFYQEKYFAAKQAFKKALALAPDNIEARNNLGWSEYQEGNYAAAQKHFDQVLARDAQYVGSILGLAKVYQGRGELGKAIGQYNQLLELSPNFVYFLDLMILYVRHYSWVFIILGLILLGVFGKSLLHSLSRDKRRSAAAAERVRQATEAESGDA